MLQFLVHPLFNQIKFQPVIETPEPTVQSFMPYWRSVSDLNTDITATDIFTAAWLAQLVERRTAVREVEGSRPDQHSGS